VFRRGGASILRVWRLDYDSVSLADVHSNTATAPSSFAAVLSEHGMAVYYSVKLGNSEGPIDSQSDLSVLCYC
jgi:hypothetical protein